MLHRRFAIFFDMRVLDGRIFWHALQHKPIIPLLVLGREWEKMVGQDLLGFRFDLREHFYKRLSWHQSIIILFHSIYPIIDDATSTISLQQQKLNK